MRWRRRPHSTSRRATGCGEKDWRAKLAHATRMRDALERAGNPPAWLVEPAEGHGFHAGDARERMYARVLAFLRENTGPPPSK